MDVTAVLSFRELQVLAQLAKQNDMSEEAVLRQALRFYQLADGYFGLGYELAFRKPDGEFIRPLQAGPKARGLGNPCPECGGTGHIPQPCECDGNCLCLQTATCPYCNGRTVVDQ